MKTSILLAASIATVVLSAGCKKKTDVPPAGSGDGGASALVAADAAAPEPDAAPPPPDAADAGGMGARPDGVGPLTSKTSDLSEKALVAAFPGHDVKRVVKNHGGDLREMYWGISKGGVLLYKVEGDTVINAVHIVGPDVPNPWGVKLGMTHAEVAKVLGELSCENGGDDTDWRSHVVVCSNEKIGNYTLDFVTPEGEGRSAAELLENEEMLAKSPLVALRWERWMENRPQ